MDFIDPILSVASQIYSLVETVKANRKRCRRVCDRVRALEKLVRSIQKREPGQTSAEVTTALRELSLTLESARELVRKYTLANWMERVLKSGSHVDEFSSLNERLNDAFQVLSGALQVEQSKVLNKVFALTTRNLEDEQDGIEDDNQLKELLLEHLKVQQENMEAMQQEFVHLKAGVETVVEILNKPSITNVDIRMIKPEELKYEHPKKPFMKTPTSEVYRGEYCGFDVAIKRFMDPVNTSARRVQAIFKEEVDTMKRFESPNILRMFGICVQDEDGPNPHFLIVMEYCEKGSLREVLKSSDCKLPWTRKAKMCLGAALGLYRLHQTGQEPKVHGCINSSKFLVSKGYTIKLGGFELPKTELSLKSNRSKEEVRSVCYTSPQKLANIHSKYTNESDIYSFGIVMWEIAAREKPFKDLKDMEILEKVNNKEQCTVKEPLPDDCPKELEQLINDCRAYSDFERPSAGVLVDKLRSLVAQLEQQ
ncbi:mixed lineage kinase domain-like protein [Nelusetta ayraudi]|uniref:mixed lineage kinase domain-like protein n=1 Tax=Nelusetta ayraudi TaxID=303726 RepID=UPI003F6EDA21